MLSSSSEQHPKTLHWAGDSQGTLRLIDQTCLPGELREIECRTVEDVWQAIRRLAVRGAPAIGCAAAYGVVLGVQGDAYRVADIFTYKVRAEGDKRARGTLEWTGERPAFRSEPAFRLLAEQVGLCRDLFADVPAMDEQSPVPQEAVQ